MDKEKLLSALKTKVGNTSLSERTLSEYVDAILPTAGEEITEAYLDMHKTILKSLEGNLNNETATRVNTFKADWEKNHPTTTPEPKKDEPKEDPRISEILKQLNELKEQRSAESKASKIANLRNGVLGKSDELKVSNKAIWNDVVASLDVAEDATADTLLAAAKSNYETKLKNYLGDGIMPYGGETSPSQDQETIKKELDSYFEKKGFGKTE